MRHELSDDKRDEVAELRAKLEAVTKERDELRGYLRMADRAATQWHEQCVGLRSDLAAARAHQRGVAVEALTEVRRYVAQKPFIGPAGFLICDAVQSYIMAAKDAVTDVIDERIAALTAPAAEPATSFEHDPKDFNLAAEMANSSPAQGGDGDAAKLEQLLSRVVNANAQVMEHPHVAHTLDCMMELLEELVRRALEGK